VSRFSVSTKLYRTCSRSQFCMNISFSCKISSLLSDHLEIARQHMGGSSVEGFVDSEASRIARFELPPALLQANMRFVLVTAIPRRTRSARLCRLHLATTIDDLPLWKFDIHSIGRQQPSTDMRMLLSEAFQITGADGWVARQKRNSIYSS
jgi:hypothetical protein